MNLQTEEPGNARRFRHEGICPGKIAESKLKLPALEEEIKLMLFLQAGRRKEHYCLVTCRCRSDEGCLFAGDLTACTCTLQCMLEN